ncbi:hypothetical protein N7499_013077 [Penicillium canescens]|nr:hypothetical protein N7522_002307 [Penicillium canescens]KAJ6064397.1 hypothetical protein N7499_013077 [Penicillium canescens]KAJ6154104.1 hypothetical protein N7485_012473 [Penicillium canescens]
MLMKNILAALTLAGLAIATPVEEDIQERQVANCPSSRNWCCVTATNLNIFFIKGVGSNCKANPNNVPCNTLPGPPTRPRPLCCSTRQVVDPKSTGTDVVCTT